MGARNVSSRRRTAVLPLAPTFALITAVARARRGRSNTLFVTLVGLRDGGHLDGLKTNRYLYVLILPLPPCLQIHCTSVTDL